MNGKVRSQTPLARKQGLVIQKLPDEVLVYDLDRDKAHCLNQTAALVWEQCNGRATTADIAQSLGERLSVPVDEKVVWFALDQLRRNHLLDQPPVLPPNMAGMNRREMVRALGIAAVVAVPVITSIIAPTPAQASTCTPSGGSCATSATCCSGVCNTNVCA
jgi:hypothetical protein